MGTGVLSPGVKHGRGVMLTTHPHIVPRSRISRIYTPLPPSATMACSGTALLFLTVCSKNVEQSLYTPWRRLGERRYSSYSFTTSALDGGEWSASRPGRAFAPGERTPGTHSTGGWVGPRAGLDTEARGKILCPCRGSNPDRPVVQPVVRHYTA
jgi:hypothetical protein